jgi:hypothetical protein
MQGKFRTSIYPSGKFQIVFFLHRIRISKSIFTNLKSTDFKIVLQESVHQMDEVIDLFQKITIAKRNENEFASVKN